MKKYFYLLLALVATLGFTACGDDDAEPTPTKTTYDLTFTADDDAAMQSIQLDNVAYADVSLPANGDWYTFAKVAGSKCTYVRVTVQKNETYEERKATVNFTAGSKTIIINITQAAAEKPYVPDTDKAEAVTKMIGFGWNLGNHFDTSCSDDDGNFVDFTKPRWGYWDHQATPTEALYQALADAGVNTVRIPVTWAGDQKNEEGYPIDADYMAEVKQNVLWAKAHGLNVILNTHHDEEWLDAYTAALSSTTNETIKKRIVATWTQIANAFKDEGDYLILETFNELHHEVVDSKGNKSWATPNAGELKIMNEWNQLAVNTIRATGGNNASRWIAVPSYQASPTYALNDAFVLPTDAADKLIVAVHCYDPYNFTIASTLTESWGTAADKLAITQLFDKLKAKFYDNNIPMYMGEFGCSEHLTDAGNKCRDFWAEYFCRAMYFARLGGCLWDNYNYGQGSEHHSYFNHNDGSWMDGHETLVKTMIKAMTSTDESYTLESITKK